jgi:predicted nucleic acid-binding protein
MMGFVNVMWPNGCWKGIERNSNKSTPGRNTTLQLPDAIIAATAVVLGATLLSNDDHLKNLIWPGYTVQAI